MNIAMGQNDSRQCHRFWSLVHAFMSVFHYHNHTIALLLLTVERQIKNITSAMRVMIHGDKMSNTLFFMCAKRQESFPCLPAHQDLSLRNLYHK